MASHLLAPCLARLMQTGDGGDRHAGLVSCLDKVGFHWQYTAAAFAAGAISTCAGSLGIGV